MCPDDPPADPPKKNIFIVLDFVPHLDQNGKMVDTGRDNIEFQGLEEEGWHGIWAKDVIDADKQLKEYLGGSEANNIVMESHGGLVNGDESKPVFNINNDTQNYIDNETLENSLKGTNTTNVPDLDALKSIISQVSSGGNFYLNTCRTATGDVFFNNLQTLTENKVNMFGNCDWGSMRYKTDPLKPGTAILTPATLFNKDFINPINYKIGSRMYQAGCAGESIVLKNMQINSSGIKPIF
jgi:hypothetical protein